MKVLYLLILLFFACACTNHLKPNQNLIFELDAIVLQNDEFQLFYSNDFINEYSETESVKREIIGKADTQLIKFLLPNGVNPNRIRIDLGKNSSQSKIVMSKIAITLGRQKIIFKDKLKNEIFLPNNCIDLNKNNYNLKVLKGVYDPYIISKNLNSAINLLIEQN